MKSDSCSGNSRQGPEGQDEEFKLYLEGNSLSLKDFKRENIIVCILLGCCMENRQ